VSIHVFKVRRPLAGRDLMWFAHKRHALGQQTLVRGPHVVYLKDDFRGPRELRRGSGDQAQGQKAREGCNWRTPSMMVLILESWILGGMKSGLVYVIIS